VYVLPKDEIWFLRVRHHISNAVYYSGQEMYLLQTFGPLLCPPNLIFIDYRRLFPNGKAAGASSSQLTSTLVPRMRMNYVRTK